MYFYPLTNIHEVHYAASLTLPALPTQPLLTISKRSLRKRKNTLLHSTNGNIRSKLLISHWNAGPSRLENKIQHLELFIREHRPSLFGISEANMTSNTSLTKVEMEGYDLVTTDAFEDPLQTNSRLVVYVADNLNYKVRKDLMSKTCSSIWIQVTAKNGKRSLIGYAYREFQIWGRGIETRSEGEQFTRWVTLTGQVRKAMGEGADCILLGDLNVDYKTWNNPQYFMSRLVNEFMQEVVPLGAIQLITEDTRTRTHGQGTTLDHIWVNCPDVTSNVSVGHQGPSDHKPISVVYGSCDHKLGETMVSKRSMNNFCEVDYRRRLEAAGLLSILQETCVNKAVAKFTTIVGGVLEEVAPKKLVQVRRNFAPWIQKDTLELMKKRDQAAKIKDTGGEDEVTTYRKKRNETNRKIERDKKDWENRAIKASEEDKTGALLWKFAKKNMSKAKSGPPKSIQHEGRILNKPKEIAEAQAEYYSKKIEKINTDLEEAKLTAGDPLDILRSSLASWDRWNDNQPGLTLQPISIADTQRLLAATSSSSTEGFDNISSNAIKTAGEPMLLVVRHLVNLSLKSGIFPEGWKGTKVKPLYKGKGQMTSPSSFRPIAILSATSKVLEKAVTEQITGYFVRNGLINENHHAYQANKSTTTALQHLTDNLSEMLERGETGIAVILDMSAAFDSVDVALLCQKLELYGLDSTAVQWMKTYLEKRQFAVEIGGMTGSLRESSSGVPQGSVLGPVLFTVFTNELPSVIQYHCHCCRDQLDRRRSSLFKTGCVQCGSTTNYADDVTHVFGEKDMGVGVEKMRSAVSQFTDFLTSNSLKLNDDKTHTLKVMTRQRRVFSQEDDLDTVFGGRLVKPSSKEKLLGCWLSCNLTWRSQILEGQDSIRGKISRKLGELWRMGTDLKSSSKIKLANGTVMSLLSYAAPVWGGESATSLRVLQTLQNKAARWCLGTGKRTRISELMTRCGWLSVLQTIKYTSLVSLWKTLHLDTGLYWRTRIIREGGERPLRSTDEGSLIPCPKPWMDLTRASWRWRAVVDWNGLPPALRQDLNLRSFKCLLKSWIRQNVPLVHPRNTIGGV